MRVIFTRDYDFHIPGKRAHVAYKAGHEYVVKREWGDAMVSAGAAVEAHRATEDVSGAEMPDDAATRLTRDPTAKA